MEETRGQWGPHTHSCLIGFFSFWKHGPGSGGEASAIALLFGVGGRRESAYLSKLQLKHTLLVWSPRVQFCLLRTKQTGRGWAHSALTCFAQEWVQGNYNGPGRRLLLWFEEKWCPLTHAFEWLGHYEQVWPCWRKHVTVEAGFKVFYGQAMPSVAHSLLLHM